MYTSPREQVRLHRCSVNTTDAQVIEATFETITALPDYGAGFAGARTIAVKINAGVKRVQMAHGRCVELTDPAVVEGTIRAIREVSDAEILVGDGTTSRDSWELYQILGYPERLSRYSDVRLVDFNQSELVAVEMSHASAMFREYMLPREVVEADAIVSISKMKAHQSIGFTLCIKNLFGWMPISVYGAPRMYLHDRLIRLPRVLADLATFTRPCLNVVDGIVAAAKKEWGGDVLTPQVLIAGTNVVATDTVGTAVMGFDATEDYPSHPYFYRRNPIKLAAEAGLGSNRLEDVEIIGEELAAMVTPFEVSMYRGATHRAEQLRQGAECVAHYRERQDEYAARYRNRYLAFRGDELLWDGPDVQTMLLMEDESGRNWQNAPHFMVRCVPSELEIERFEWYDVDSQCLADVA